MQQPAIIRCDIRANYCTIIMQSIYSRLKMFRFPSPSLLWRWVSRSASVEQKKKKKEHMNYEGASGCQWRPVNKTRSSAYKLKYLLLYKWLWNFFLLLQNIFCGNCLLTAKSLGPFPTVVLNRALVITLTIHMTFLNSTLKFSVVMSINLCNILFSDSIWHNCPRINTGNCTNSGSNKKRL